MAYTLSSPTEGGLYCAFNSSHKAQVVELPHWPGTQWQLLMDSGRVSSATSFFLFSLKHWGGTSVSCDQAAADSLMAGMMTGGS